MQNFKRATQGQWPLVAHVWKELGPPLRPSGEDVSYALVALEDWCARRAERSPRGLILGVTPELYLLPWPDCSLLFAVDRTPEMIRDVWPGNPSSVLREDWREIRLPAGSVDIAMCDGGIHLLDYPQGQLELYRKLAMLIAPGGTFVLRLFVPPALRETSSDILDDLLDGDIPSLNCLKLRLGMALQESPSIGVPLNSVWHMLRSVLPSPEAHWSILADRLDWSVDHLSVIDTYRDSPARYFFVTVEEVRRQVREGTDGAFEFHSMNVPTSYPMATQCPTVVFRRTPV